MPPVKQSSEPDDRAEEHGRFIKEKRLDLGLNRPAFVAQMAKHGQDITSDYLNKIERGTAPLSRASLEVRESIRIVLGYSAEDWHKLTGLYTPMLAAPEPEPVAVFDPRALFHPPAERRREKRPLWPNLAAMIEEKQERYPQLRETRWQQHLNQTRFANGQDPDPDGWFEMYQAMRRNNVEPEAWPDDE